MKKNYRKRVIASALVIGAMAGGVGMVSGQMVSATEGGDEKPESSNHKKPELSEEKKAEIKEKLDAMTKEERNEPANVVNAVHKLAEIKEMDVSIVDEVTTNNARNIFKI